MKIHRRKHLEAWEFEGLQHTDTWCELLRNRLVLTHSVPASQLRDFHAELIEHVEQVVRSDFHVRTQGDACVLYFVSATDAAAAEHSIENT